jgi:hypothetical protein
MGEEQTTVWPEGGQEGKTCSSDMQGREERKQPLSGFLRDKQGDRPDGGDRKLL